MPYHIVIARCLFFAHHYSLIGIIYWIGVEEGSLLYLFRVINQIPATASLYILHSSVLSDPPVFVRAVPDIVNYIHIMPIQRITLQLLVVKPRFLPRSYSSPGVRLCRQTVVPPRITFISSSMADYRWVLSNSGFQLSSRARSDLALALYRKNSSEHEPRLAIE